MSDFGIGFIDGAVFAALVLLASRHDWAWALVAVFALLVVAPSNLRLV